jgi:hypothetical protein
MTLRGADQGVRHFMPKSVKDVDLIVVVGIEGVDGDDSFPAATTAESVAEAPELQSPASNI